MPLSRSPRLSRPALAALLVAATVLAYLPALRGGFIFDDDVFLTNNPAIHAADGLARFWSGRGTTDFWPVTSSSLWLEWRLWGMNAAGYHATNLALHLIDVFLLWALLRRLEIPGAFVAALLCALHPLNAETVAWITERKNLLALFFFLLSLRAAAESGLAGPAPRLTRRRGAWYGASLLLLALAMLSKSSALILPAVLVGFALWRGRPGWRHLLLLVPFFAVAGGLAWFQSQFATVLEPGSGPSAGPLALLLRAGAIPWFYLGKILWPAGLAFDYGPWKVDPAEARWWLPLLMTLAFTALLGWFGRGRARPALFAWLYFCAALFPVLGFVEVGFMKYSPVSDHFAHLALIGPVVLAGYAWHGAARRIGTAGAAVPAAAVLAFLGVLTWRQAGVFSNTTSLYRDAIARNPDSWLGHANLGVDLLNRGRNEEGMAELRRAVRLNSGFADAHANLGVGLFRTGHGDEALAEYAEALRLRPDHPETLNNLGVALAVSGRLDEALRRFRQALSLDPENADARKNLAHAEELIRGQGRDPDAVR